jgi:microcystin-dependent protein
LNARADKLSTPFTESYLTFPSGGTALALNAPADTAFASAAVGGTTGGAEHENRQPFLALTYVISLGGVFPTFPPS